MATTSEMITEAGKSARFLATANLTLLDVAIVCHEANRAYCASLGDFSQLSWDAAPEWQKESALDGVRKIASGGVTRPGQSHASWMAHKIADGWTHGPVKDAGKKQHPSLVPYAELPLSEQLKDYVFVAIASALLGKRRVCPNGCGPNEACSECPS